MFECGAKRTAHSQYRQTKSAFGVIGVLIRLTLLMSLLKMDDQKKGNKMRPQVFELQEKVTGWLISAQSNF